MAEITKAQVLSHRRSPIEHRWSQMREASGSQVALRELPFQTQIGLRALPGSPAGDGLEAALGASLPTGAGQVIPVSRPVPGHVLWFGPDDFLLVTADEAELALSSAELTEVLAEAVGKHRGQAVELSGNRTVLELSGPRAVDVLYKMVQVDVHPGVFAIGSVILTLIAGASAAVWRTGEDTYRLMPRSSFTSHTVSWLLDGMREFADRDC